MSRELDLVNACRAYCVLTDLKVIRPSDRFDNAVLRRAIRDYEGDINQLNEVQIRYIAGSTLGSTDHAEGHTHS